MKARLFFFCAIFLASCTTTANLPTVDIPEVISLRSSFNAIFSDDLKQSSEYLVSKHLLAGHEDVYSNLVFSGVSSEKKQKMIRDFVAESTPVRQKIDTTFVKLEEAASKSARSFKKIFPNGDYNYQTKA